MKRVISFVFTFLMFFCLLASACAIESGNSVMATCENNGCTAKITSLYVQNDRINIYIDFTNSTDKPQNYNLTFTLSVYQGGIECDPAYFSRDNITTNVKGGATIQVKDCFYLKNTTDIIELTLSEWLTGGNKTTIYADPVKNVWYNSNPAEPSPAPTITISSERFASLKDQVIYGYFYPGMKKHDAVNYCKAIGCKDISESYSDVLGYTAVVVKDFPHKYESTPSEDTDVRMFVMLLNPDDESIVDGFMIH